MSAHVIAKPQAFSSEDDEKTTIESAWEEEASTTVEQGDVADKIRALGIEPKQPSEGNTSTSREPLDEMTVDEARGNPAFAMMTPPAIAPARVVVTQGNDTGQELELRPGKIYSIGRGIDNDFVLTDITVSRKHFELRYEGDAWILADRGSGNGTLVNGNIEDHPFMLANGDTIEIGNTLFRFDNVNGATRSAAAGFDVDVDDEEEPSTVAGKPLRTEIPATPEPLPPPQIISRPKTQPPPPPRPRVSTMQPVFAAPQMQPIVHPPATTLPMPQMTPRGPMATPGAPTMLGEPVMPQLQPPMMPTTLPGGHVAPPPPAHVLPFTYPVVGSVERPSQPPHAQMLVIAAAHAQGRDATSTALVPPTPYHNGLNGMMPGTPPSFTAEPRRTAPISRRTKLVLGGAALTMVAAITTVLIIKTVGGGSTPAKQDDDKSAVGDKPKDQAAKDKQPFQINPIDPKDGAKPADDVAKKKAEDEAKKKALADADAKKKAEEAKILDDAKKKAEEDAKRKADEEARRKAEEKRIADAEAKRKADEDKRKLAEQRAADLKAADERRKQELAARREAELERQEERKKAAEERKHQDEERKKAAAQARTKEAPPKRIATAVNAEARSSAEREYRAKNFAAAGAVLRAAAANASAGEASDLRALAGTYEQFGKAYNAGMAPGTSPQEAFERLRTARNFDPSLGGAYTSEIVAHLKQVAPRAAIFFAAKKDFDNAIVAVKTAESLGVDSSSGNIKAVRSALEQEANRLYTEAANAPPDEAKQKAKRILNLIDSKSPTYAKAQKLANS